MVRSSGHATAGSSFPEASIGRKIARQESRRFIRRTVLLALTAFHDLDWDGTRGHGVVGSGGRFFEFASGRCGAAVRSPIKIGEPLKVELVVGWDRAAVVFVETGAEVGTS